MSLHRTERVLDVIIGCDCDPDRPKYGGTRYDTRAPLRWLGVTEGVPRLREIADGVTDDFGSPVRLTWCIRSDLQMEEVYGDCAWPAAEFASLWRVLERGGDELAWHPHVWRWDDRADCWYQETEDDDWTAECLRAGYRELARSIGRTPHTCRTGWEFHNNTTMSEIRRLGIKADFSAIPGRYTPGSPDRNGSRFCCHVDWREAPIEMYKPSSRDYRLPADGDAHGLYEIPMSVVDLPLLTFARITRKICSGRVGAIRELRAAFTCGDGSARGNKLYATTPPVAFSRLAAQQIRLAQERGHATLVTALHPDEMLATGRGLTSLCHSHHLKANLANLMRLGEHFDVRIRFTTPQALISAMPQELKSTP